MYACKGTDRGVEKAMGRGKQQRTRFMRNKNALVKKCFKKRTIVSRKGQEKSFHIDQSRKVSMTSGQNVQKLRPFGSFGYGIQNIEQKEPFPYHTQKIKQKKDKKRSVLKQKQFEILNQNGKKTEQVETFGQNVQKLKPSKTFDQEMQKTEQTKTFGQNVQKWKSIETFAQEMKKAEQSKTFRQNVQKSKLFETFKQEIPKLEQVKIFVPPVSEPESGIEKVQEAKSSFLSENKKEDQQKAKLKKKKRHLLQAFQKENNLIQKERNLKKKDIDNKEQSTFFQEQSTFAKTEKEDQTKERKNRKANVYSQNTFHLSKKKDQYDKKQKWEHPDRKERKDITFVNHLQTKDTSFIDDTKAEFQDNKKLERLKDKAEKAKKQTEEARKKLPKKKEYSFVRVFDEKTGKANYVLTVVEQEKRFSLNNPGKAFIKKAGQESAAIAHRKIAEVEKENSAVEALHKTEQKAEDGYHFVKRSYRNKNQRQRKKVKKLQKTQWKKEGNFHYQKFLEENPKMQEKTLKKQLQKRWQKQRIKKAYVKARKAEQTGETIGKARNLTTIVTRKRKEWIKKQISFFVLAGVFIMFWMIMITFVSSYGGIASNGIHTILAGSYRSIPGEIDAADLAFSKLEMELQGKINTIEMQYPDYDEYHYTLDSIEHDPWTLICYLSAIYIEFTATEVQEEVERLFEERYEMTLVPVLETRTRTELYTETRVVTNVDGTIGMETDTYEVEVEYEVSILEVTLTTKELEDIVAESMNEEQKEIYALYQETNGLIQQFYSPLDLDWHTVISSYYGYRIHPITGAEQFHKGIDLAVPTGTIVYASMDGIVTTATYSSSYGNYIVIENEEGYATKYAHMDTLQVSAGQTVKHGEQIGTTGNTGNSTGSHLHLECSYQGISYNPLFYFDTGNVF